MSRVPTLTAPRKDNFLTLRVTQELRDALSVVAEGSMRSMSSQALYYIQRGLEADIRSNVAKEPPEAP